jgi:hypothetical protein
MYRRFLATLAIVAFLSTLANAIVVVNSVDARDVIEGASYANVAGESVVFVPQKADLTIFLSKVKNGGHVTLLQSANPVYINIEDIFASNKINVTRKVQLGSAADNAITLARMANPDGYIIVTSEYGYPSISALPYAKLKKYYVMLGFKENAQRIAEAAKGKPVMIFGYVSPEIQNALDAAGVGYEMVNKRDKYLDNIEMAKRYLAQSATNTFLLSDGNEIEESLINANSPVLFVSSIIPDATQAFVKAQATNGQVILNLIGSEYVQPVYNMKKGIDAELGANRCIARLKIGEAVPFSSSTPQEADTIVLPGPYAELYIDSASYNTNTKTLDITMQNSGNAPAYISMGVKAYVGNDVIGVFPSTRDFVNPDEKKGYSFNITVPKYAEGAMTAETSLLYGLSNLSLDSGLSDTRNISFITFADTSSASVENAKYDKGKKALSFLLRNNGTVKAYYKATVVAADSASSIVTFKDDRVFALEPGGTNAVIYSMLPFGDDMKSISVNLDYGARDGFLQNSASFPIRLEEDYAPLLLTGAAVFAAIAITAFIMRRAHKKEGKK